MSVLPGSALMQRFHWC